MAAPQTSAAQSEALFTKMAGDLRERLRAANDRNSIFAALRWGTAELDRTYARTPPKVKGQVACRAGCDFCCRVPMGVQAHEVFLAADHIQNHFSTAEVARVVERTAEHRKRIAGLSAAEYGKVFQRCALLRDSQCSIYESRPEICRSHHSSDAKICEAYVGDASVPVQNGYIPALRSRMFAAMLGIDQAVSDSGFDSRAYDFGSALHEALTNTLCLVLWAKKGIAFPDSCLEPALEE